MDVAWAMHSGERGGLQASIDDGAAKSEGVCAHAPLDR
jgi:hypothetical protein